MNADEWRAAWIRALLQDYSDYSKNPYWEDPKMNAEIKPGDVVQTPGRRIGKVEKVFAYKNADRVAAKIRHPDGSLSSWWVDSLYPLATPKQGITDSEIFHADRRLREGQPAAPMSVHEVSPGVTEKADLAKEEKAVIDGECYAAPGRMRIGNLVWTRRPGRDYE